MKFLPAKLILLFLILKISNNNEITITIKGNGDQKILSDEYQNEFPDKIIINGNEITYSSNIINLNGEQNNITLKWNNLANCQKMFKDLTNITEIDFSNFDCSEVKDISYMFYNCCSLESLDLSNFDTSNVESIVKIFYNCSSIKYII